MSESETPEAQRPDAGTTPPLVTPRPAPSPDVTPPVTVNQLGATEEPQVKLTVPLQSGERVLMLRRKHWIYLWPLIALNAFFGIFPVLVLAKFLDLIGVDASGGIVAIIYAVWLAIFAFRCLIIWYRYHNDTWVITNQRIVDSRRKHPFDLYVATADLVNIQDMTISRSGILKTMLDYGDIACQTAGKQEDFKITGVPHPREIQALVDKERDRERMRGR